MASDTHDLITEVTQLPVQPGAAMRVLWMLDDERAAAADLGRVIDSDPALSARVVRLANTAFFGVPGEVSTAWRAVTVLGPATVRALATTAAFDLCSDADRAVPDGFWAHSLTAAAAAAAVARRVGTDVDDAFGAGLLHDLGAALVFRRAPRRYDLAIRRRAASPGTRAVDVEMTELGATHAHVGAAALGIMRFPAAMVEAVAAHHREPRDVSSLLGRVLVAADAIALELGAADAEDNAGVEASLDALGVPASAAGGIVAEVRADREHLAGFLAPA